MLPTACMVRETESGKRGGMRREDALTATVRVKVHMCPLNKNQTPALELQHLVQRSLPHEFTHQFSSNT